MPANPSSEAPLQPKSLHGQPHIDRDRPQDSTPSGSKREKEDERAFPNRDPAHKKTGEF